MARQDFILGTDYEDIIRDGDFIVGDADEDNVDLILQLQKGHSKYNPLLGVGIQKDSNSILGLSLKQEIKKQLLEDKYNTNLVYTDPVTQVITVDFT